MIGNNHPFSFKKMNPEVEKLLNEMRENKRKMDESAAERAKTEAQLKISNEKKRREQVHELIQKSQVMWEAEERFHEETGEKSHYSDMICPTCNCSVRSDRFREMCIKCITYVKPRIYSRSGELQCQHTPYLGGSNQNGCNSCYEILSARNDFCVIRRSCKN